MHSSRDAGRRGWTPGVLTGWRWCSSRSSLLPLVALGWRAVDSGELRDNITSELVLDAMRLSAITSTIALILRSSSVRRWPTCWRGATSPARSWSTCWSTCPIVLPPTVAGVALLVAFGRRGVAGQQLDALGIELAFTTTAVVLAQLFVSAPYYIRTVKAGFESVSPGVRGRRRDAGRGPAAHLLARRRCRWPGRPCWPGRSCAGRAPSVSWARRWSSRATSPSGRRPCRWRSSASSTPASRWTSRSRWRVILVLAAAVLLLLLRVARQGPARPASRDAISVDFEKRLGDFHLRPRFEAEDELVVLLGPSGSGKSLTLRAIAGLLTPGQRPHRASRRRRLRLLRRDRRATAGAQRRLRRAGAGVVPPPDSGGEHRLRAQRLAAEAQRDARDARAGRAAGPRGARRPAAARRSPAGSSSAWRWAGRWRRGRRVLLLDEPFSALDAPMRNALRREVARLRRQLGLPALFVTHDLQEAYALADRIAVYDGGQVLQCGGRTEVFRPGVGAGGGATGCAEHLRGPRDRGDRRLRRSGDGLLPGAGTTGPASSRGRSGRPVCPAGARDRRPPRQAAGRAAGYDAGRRNR